MRVRPIELRKEGGRLLALVPLGRSGALFAELWVEDWDFLIKLGTPGNWTSIGQSGHVGVSSNRASGNKLSVARILKNAGPGETVKFGDGNPHNLRSENLTLVRAGWSCRRDRDLLPLKRAA